MEPAHSYKFVGVPKLEDFFTNKKRSNMLLESLETRQKESYNSRLRSHSVSMIDSNNKVSTIGGRCQNLGGGYNSHTHTLGQSNFCPKFADLYWDKIW